MTSHGIADGRIVATYRLGVVDKPLTGDERFTGMMAIPYLTRRGVRAIRFRNLGDGKPKFAQHYGQTARLYNPAAYFTADDTIGIAEGEIDAIVATEVLSIPTVGIPGTEMWTAHRDVWAPVFKNFNRVIVFADGDPVDVKTGRRPGEDLGRAIAESLKWRARVINLPEGQDVSSMVAAGRADEILSKIGDKDEE